MAVSSGGGIDDPLAAGNGNTVASASTVAVPVKVTDEDVGASTVAADDVGYGDDAVANVTSRSDRSGATMERY